MSLIATAPRSWWCSTRSSRSLPTRFSATSPTVLPGWLGLDTQGFEVGVWEVARTVLIFLGIPLAAGFLTRRLGLRRKGRDWYEQRFLPSISPITLYGLLFTIVLLFAIQGDKITAEPQDVAMIALPLLVYFAACGSQGSQSAGDPPAVCADVEPCVHRRLQRLRARDRRCRRRLRRKSGEALAGVVGPLIEVPVLVSLVYVALWLARRLRWPSPLGLGAGGGAARLRLLNGNRTP